MSIKIRSLTVRSRYRAYFNGSAPLPLPTPPSWGEGIDQRHDGGGRMRPPSNGSVPVRRCSR